MKAVVFNLGCKVNQYECDIVSAKLQEMGLEVSDNLEFADLYVVNTCAVTNTAEKKSRQIIARVKKFNENAKLIIMGCASQKNPQFFIDKSVSTVIGTAKKDNIAEFLENAVREVFDIPSVYEDSLILPKTNRTRVFVKIQDGCNCFCSYCIIPYLRGRSRSRSLLSIKNEVEKLAVTTKEIVLTGINLSAYGKDIGLSLVDLINQLKDVDVRIRLGSFYAEGIDENLLTSLKNLKDFCPHFHLSLQNGDDKVLKDMNRHYTTAEYQDKINLIRNYFKNPSITTDIIVGYPTETDEAFENTLNFVGKTKINDVHIFKYSKRQGTASYDLCEIPSNIVAERYARLDILSKSLNKEYLIGLIGKKLDVLFEEEKDGYFVGHSKEYVKIYCKDTVKYGKILITELFKDGLLGVRNE